MARVLPVFLFTASLALVSCSKPTEPDRAGDPTPDTRAEGSATRPGARPGGPHGGAPPAGAHSAELGWETPPIWPRADNPTPLRLATYRVPRADGDAEDGELSVAQAGGSLDQNLARWAGQFDQKLADVKREVRTVHGLKVTVVEIHGTYKAMAMPGAPPAVPRNGQALLGAITATSPPTFFKLTGPEKTVLAARHDFDQFVASLRSK
jgi:hypothetical protein